MSSHLKTNNLFRRLRAHFARLESLRPRQTFWFRRRRRRRAGLRPNRRRYRRSPPAIPGRSQRRRPLRFPEAVRFLCRTELRLLVRARGQRAFHALEKNRPRRVRSPTRGAPPECETNFPRARRGRPSGRSDANREKSLADRPMLPCVPTRRRTRLRGCRPREETPRCELFATAAKSTFSAARGQRRRTQTVRRKALDL